MGQCAGVFPGSVLVRRGIEVTRSRRLGSQPDFFRASFNLSQSRISLLRVKSLFNRQDLIGAFESLDEELSQRGVRAELFVVGGAAMAIAYDARRTTSDVDAIFVPAEVVQEAARVVAEQLDLEPDWLNDGAKSFAPGSDPAQVSVFEGEFLSVAVASPRYLLAMKLLASRTDRDIDDIKTLYILCGLSTPEEGAEILEAYYPARIIPARAQLLLQELFPANLLKDRDSGLGR
jgi:hypothetical protein